MSHFQSPFRVLWLALCLLLCLGACSSSATEACTDCVSGSVSAALSAPVADWSARVPTFATALQVVDGEGMPVAGAEVAVGARIILTDSDGWVRYSDVRALAPQPMRASQSGYMPTVWTPTVISSGLITQQAVLHRLPAVQQVIDPNKPSSLASAGAQFRLPRLPFLAADGARLTDVVKARVLSLDGAVVPAGAMPGDRLATGNDGRPVALGEMLQLAYATLEDRDGKAVKLAPGVEVTLTLRLSRWSPPETTLDGDDDHDDDHDLDGDDLDGDDHDDDHGDDRGRAPTLGLYSLDSELGRWVRESSCRVNTVQGAALCTGKVSHFGYWLVALEQPAAADLGCVHITVASPDGTLAGVDGALSHLPLQRCAADGKTCELAASLTRGLSVQLPPRSGGTGLPGMCSLVEVGEHYGARVAARSKGGQMAIAGAHFVATEASSAMADDWLRRGLPGEWDCAGQCQPVVISATGDLLWSGLEDKDGDGFVAGAAGPATALALKGLNDCEDGDRHIHPGAVEGPCSTEDRDCDGFSGREVDSYPVTEGAECAWTVAALHAGLPACPALFNHSCGAACFARGAEQSGNAMDEDCDGRLADADGDGLSSWATDGELDCDDFRPGAGPGQQEVPGNDVDEDCDGLALDADADGYFGYGQEMAAIGLGLASGDDASRFGDCDDEDPRVYPGADLALEVGQLAAFFVEDGDRGKLRLASYCDYFDPAGQRTDQFQRKVRDMNCDGRLTDLDGDGYAARGDESLGQDRAVDCNDMDPRVGPAEGGECEDFASTLNNASACYPALPEDGSDTCPSIANSSTEVKCMDVGNGNGLCLYSGWNGSDPPRLMPGTLWGPCDGPGRLLADCPQNAFCGAPVAFSSQLMGYLETYFTGGEPLDATGMCFQSCTVEQE